MPPQTADNPPNVKTAEVPINPPTSKVTLDGDELDGLREITGFSNHTFSVYVPYETEALLSDLYCEDAQGNRHDGGDYENNMLRFLLTATGAYEICEESAVKPVILEEPKAAVRLKQTTQVSEQRGFPWLAGQKDLTEAELAASRRYAALQQAYVTQSERHLHETRNRTLMLRHYALVGEQQKLLDALDHQLGESDIPGLRYSDNGLLDAQLLMEDADLASLVTNVLDNAVRAAEQAESEKWLSVSLPFAGGILTLHCAKAKGHALRKKRRGHGRGLLILQEIAVRYGGEIETEDLGDSVEIHIRLMLADHNTNTDTGGPQ